MISLYFVMLSLVIGACAGALFFEGLWRTVSKAGTSTRPVLLFLVSFLARAAILLIVFWFASGGNALRLAACLFGFLLARTLMIQIHQGRNSSAN